MKENSLDNTLQQILKKLLLVVIGSGLISNALYIYGLSYYQGYIERLGFEYTFFPVGWDETLLWTYFASRELGASTVNLWTKLTGPILIVLMLVVYILARIWMAINEQDTTKKIKNTRSNYWFSHFLVKCRKLHRPTFNILYPPLRWLLIQEQSLWAFVASYFFLIVLIFIPFFIFIWVYFPMFGVTHGEYIGTKRLERYQKALCGDTDDYWRKCVEIDTSHLKNKRLPGMIEGRLIAKNGNLIGILTMTGPVTMTMSILHFHKTEKNPCFGKECKSMDKAN